MPIEETLMLIENHWISFFITVVFLYYIIKIINLYYNKLEKKIIKDHAKDLKEKWPKTIAKNNIIHQLLYKILYKYNWDRAYIYEYHNWWHSISWIDFLKCSNTFEVLNENTRQRQHKLQWLPIWMFAFWNMKVLRNQITFVENIESIKDQDFTAYQMLKQQEIKSTFIIWLYDAQNNPIWFFWIDYITNEMECIDEIEMKKDLEVLSYKMAWLLY